MIRVLAANDPTGGVLRLRVACDDGRVELVEIAVPGGETEPIQEEFTGRLLTESGAWVVPVIEVDGDFQPRPDNPADPYVRVSRLDALTAHVAQVLAGIDNTSAASSKAAAAAATIRRRVSSGKQGPRLRNVNAMNIVGNLAQMGIVSK